MENDNLTEKAKHLYLPEEVEDLKMRLQLSISNAKRNEEEVNDINFKHPFKLTQQIFILFQFSQTEALLVAASEEEKGDLKKSSARFTKQIETLKSDLEKFKNEAIKVFYSIVLLVLGMT